MLSELEKGLGYVFRDKALLTNALTHSSYANENRDRGIHDNERLEFLGDSILGFVVADYLYRNFPGKPEVFLRGGGFAFPDDPFRLDAVAGEPFIHTLRLRQILTGSLAAGDNGNRIRMFLQILQRGIQPVCQGEGRG